MPRPRRVRVAAINIATNPHSPESYVELWNKLFGLRQPIALRNDQALMIGSVEAASDPAQPNLEGSLYRFTLIDTSKPWFLIDEGKEADPDRVRREVRIPPNLRPNLVTFRYEFFPKRHRLVVECTNDKGESLSPAYVERLIGSLTMLPEIARKFETVEATVEKDEEKIDQIVSSPSLTSLEITVKRPNSDDDSRADEAEVFRQLEQEGARKKTLKLQAARGKAIAPSRETRTFARVARSNGNVIAKERTEDGRVRTLSSEQHPRIEQESYDPNQTTRAIAFAEAARKILRVQTPSERG
jgi:hypothetical protein